MTNISFYWHEPDQKWVMCVNGLILKQVTGDEMEKINLARKVVSEVTTVLKSNLTSKDLTKVFFDKGYNSSGSNPIVDADLVSLGITAAEFGDAINLLQQVQKFFNNEAVLQGDWYTVANRIRNDI